MIIDPSIYFGSLTWLKVGSCIRMCDNNLRNEGPRGQILLYRPGPWRRASLTLMVGAHIPEGWKVRPDGGEV